eukprot:scaffold10_cov367-Pavlova_lutheri.AAC.3
MNALLVTKGVGEAITKKDSEHSEKALALMCLCVSNEYVDLVANSESAQHAWTMLEDMHAGQTAARRLTLRKELTGLTKKPEESMMSFIMRGKQICTNLRAIDGSVTDIHLIDAILSGLPEEYANKVEMLTTLGERDMPKFRISFSRQKVPSPCERHLEARLLSLRRTDARSLPTAIVAEVDMAAKNVLSMLVPGLDKTSPRLED